MNLMGILNRNWALTRKVAPMVGLILFVKVVLHLVGLEFLSLNPLFTGLVAANVFLLGFLLTGVLSDFKESEKLPGDLACCLDTIFDEASIIYAGKKAPAALECMTYLRDLAIGFRKWFYKEQHARGLMESIAGLNSFFLRFEPLAQPPFVTRLKTEQNNLRRMLVRIHTIRDTDFVTSGYVIAEATTFLLTIGLLFSQIEPFIEAIFMVIIITYLLVFMLALIRDLDNPFDYYEKGSAEDVSLKPLEDTIKRLEREVAAVTDGEQACAEAN